MVSPEEQGKYLETIMNKSFRMNELIQLLFDYVKLKSDGFQIQKEPLELCEFLRECSAVQYQDILDAGMELQVEIPEKELWIQADKVQFSRALTNLLVNAVRHNEKGTEIGVYLTEEDDLHVTITPLYTQYIN